MHRYWKSLLTLAAILLAATPLFGQTAGAAAAGAGSAASWAPIGAGIGMGIASGLCGIGQGRAAASAAEGLARNPGAAAGIRFVFILGVVLIESLALYTFAIVLLKV